MVNECTPVFDTALPCSTPYPTSLFGPEFCTDVPFRSRPRLMGYCWDDPEPVSSWRAQAYIRAARNTCGNELLRGFVSYDCWQLTSGYWIAIKSGFTSCRSQRLN